MKEKKTKNFKKELFIKILLLLILILLIIITSFRTGRKFYLLTNTYFENTKGFVNSRVARWNLNVKITIGDEEVNNEEDNKSD